MLLWLILLVIGILYDVTVLVLVTVTQGLFPLTHLKRPNKSLLCYSAHVSFCSNQVTDPERTESGRFKFRHTLLHCSWPHAYFILSSMNLFSL